MSEMPHTPPPESNPASAPEAFHPTEPGPLSQILREEPYSLISPLTTEDSSNFDTRLDTIVGTADHTHFISTSVRDGEAKQATFESLEATKTHLLEQLATDLDSNPRYLTLIQRRSEAFGAQHEKAGEYTAEAQQKLSKHTQAPATDGQALERPERPKFTWWKPTKKNREAHHAALKDYDKTWQAYAKNKFEKDNPEWTKRKNKIIAADLGALASSAAVMQESEAWRIQYLSELTEQAVTDLENKNPDILSNLVQEKGDIEGINNSLNEDAERLIRKISEEGIDQSEDDWNQLSNHINQLPSYLAKVEELLNTEDVGPRTRLQLAAMHAHLTELLIKNHFRYHKLREESGVPANATRVEYRGLPEGYEVTEADGRRVTIFADGSYTVMQEPVQNSRHLNPDGTLREPIAEPRTNSQAVA